MLNQFGPIAVQALKEPREAATTMLSMGVPRQALWPAFLLLVVLSVILMSVSNATSGPTGAAIFSPFALVGMSAIAGAASVFAVFRVGQLMGGTGSFEEALLLTVFLQGIIFVGQVIEVFLFFTLTPISSLFSIVLLVLTFWLNLNFIATLHGFSSLGRAFVVLLLASLAVAVVLGIAMQMAGVELVGLSNV